MENQHKDHNVLAETTLDKIAVYVFAGSNSMTFARIVGTLSAIVATETSQYAVSLRCNHNLSFAAVRV